ncbi:hypothetical protein OG528_31740 [Streptomyces platensis]|uniref:hypothetical protein n=1 Tax=Streptomyces platensis TaxID=58346 RepID=UPI0030DE8A65
MTADLGAARFDRPQLPPPRGCLSGTVISWLPTGQVPLPTREEAQPEEPYGTDLQLALYVLYELHYQGFDHVDDDHAWAPELLVVRRYLGEAFLRALRADVPAPGVREALAGLLTEPAADDGSSVSHYLKRERRLWQLRQVVRRERVDGLLRDEPDLDADDGFGVVATGLLEGRLAGYLLAAWRAGRSALVAPLPVVRARTPLRSAM